MDTLHIALSVIEVLACLFLIVTVLLQEGASQGLSGTISGGATFFGSKKGHGMQSTLNRITGVVAVYICCYCCCVKSAVIWPIYNVYF